MTKLRALVVDDSATLRGYLCDTLRADPDIEVVGEASNGKQCIELCERLRPDVITLDMVLPEVSGLAATEYIMAHCPTPILIVSASTNRGELFCTYDALVAGAVDVLDKPRVDEPDGDWEKRFLAAVRMVARIRVIRRPMTRSFPSPPQDTSAIGWPDGERVYHIAALGASTGGPGALVEILRAIPAPYPLPILIVLHIGAPFGAAIAEWLAKATGHLVSEGRDGEAISTLAKRVVMAPPGRHLMVRAGKLWLNEQPERHSCRPAVDCLFESLATEYGPRAIAALLTGMGRDGAAGLLAMRRAGALTIAQDEASSVIYGMPREAALLGAATRVLPLRAIGPLLGDLGLRRRVGPT